MNTFLIYISLVTTTFVLLIGLYKYNILNSAFRMLLFLVAFSFIIDITTHIFTLNNIHNLWLINVYVLLEGFLLLMVYFLMMPNSKIRKYIPLIAFLYLSVGIVEWIFWIDDEKLLSLTLIIEALLMLILSLNAFYILLQKLEYQKIQHNPVFWFNVGVLLYFAGGLFITSFSNYILKLPEIGLWMIHNVLHFLYFCSFTIAFWKTTTK